MADERPFDALLPLDIAQRAEMLGVKKAAMPWDQMLGLAVLAGAFIGLGAAFSTTVATSPGLPYGIGRLFAGLVFCLGLILVVVGGAELFTGNNLIVMAVAAGRVKISALLQNWLWVYLGNFVGAVGTAVLVFLSGQYGAAQGAVGQKALELAAAKCSLPFGRAFFLGVLCNALVCLAVWLSYGARSTTDKVLAVIFPITAFVALGFEHSIANMYFIPLALLVRLGAPGGFWEQIGRTAADYDAIDLAALGANLLPVTLGNIVGGGLLVGLVYWFIYLRPRGEKS